jgi:hydroxypyruvate isomerase
VKLSVCIDAIFRGIPAPEAMRLTHEAGYDTYEFWGWWDRDIDSIKAAKDELGLEVSVFCTKPVSLVDASVKGEYLEGLKESIAVAKKLNCKKLITLAGNDTGRPREEQKKNLIDGLRVCVPILEKEDITLVIEPLNILVDH